MEQWRYHYRRPAQGPAKRRSGQTFVTAFTTQAMDQAAQIPCENEAFLGVREDPLGPVRITRSFSTSSQQARNLMAFVLTSWPWGVDK